LASSPRGKPAASAAVTDEKHIPGSRGFHRFAEHPLSRDDERRRRVVDLLAPDLTRAGFALTGILHCAATLLVAPYIITLYAALHHSNNRAAPIA
jgi:hypothetical protein